MEKWLRVSVCLVVTFTHTAFADVVYLHAQCNDSIEFSCVPPEKFHGQLFAVSLKRVWLKREEVFYHNFKAPPKVKDQMLTDRIWDVRDVDQTVNVSIVQLQRYDTDVYECVFHYSTATNFQNHSGRDKFVLYVQEPCPDLCKCSLYTPLLFSLSAAAGLLFFILLLLVAVHCVRTDHGGQTKPQLTIPIYEEMNGVREKVIPRPQEDDISSLYVRPKKENPYSN